MSLCKLAKVNAIHLTFSGNNYFAFRIAHVLQINLLVQMDLNVLILGENVIDDKIAGMRIILMLENVGSIYFRSEYFRGHSQTTLTARGAHQMSTLLNKNLRFY